MNVCASSASPEPEDTTQGGSFFMKIRQQKQIKAFLAQEFGSGRGCELFERQSEKLVRMISDTKGKSGNQVKTLVQTILPRIALFKALSEGGFSEDDAYTHTRKYMNLKVAAQKHSFTARMEAVPGFFAIYRRVFLKIMRTSDLWESRQKYGDDFFAADITKCLWRTACIENGCPDLCRLFCDVDDITYGGLKKMGFRRTKTLGYGGDCCDFHFFRK